MMDPLWSPLKKLSGSTHVLSVSVCELVNCIILYRSGLDCSMYSLKVYSCRHFIDSYIYLDFDTKYLILKYILSI